MIKINLSQIQQLSDDAQLSPRRRKNYNFHKEDAALLQRMLNAMEPDTYIQPHKHENPDKVEAFFVLRGTILLVEFTDDGKISDYCVLNPLKGNFGGEVAPRTWHTLICLEKGSVAYEVKDGPYDPTIDKQFAPWAPAEGEMGGDLYNQSILKQLNLL